jgi:hypothetical protein
MKNFNIIFLYGCIFLSLILSASTLNAQPVIDSVSPPLGPARTIITIYGSGFSPIPSENSVTIGANIPIIKQATPTELKVVLPRVIDPPTGGTFPVTVVVGGVAASSPSPFTVLPNLIYDAPQINHATMLDLVMGDFDGDSLDEVMSHGYINPNGILKTEKKKGKIIENNDPTGGELQPLPRNSGSRMLSIPDFELDTTYTGMLSADSDGDSIIDYIGFTALQSDSTRKPRRLAAIRSIPSPSRGEKLVPFCTVPLRSEDTVLTAAALAELTNDDTIEVVCAYEASGGSLNLWDITKITTDNKGRKICVREWYKCCSSHRINAFAFADLNGDGDRDIIIATDNGVLIYQNDYPTFDFIQTQTVDDMHPYSDVAVGDINADGHLDIVGLRSDSGIVNVFFGDTSSPGRVLPAQYAGSGMATGTKQHKSLFLSDFDGDGDLDIIGAGADYIPIVRALLFEGGVVSTAVNILMCDDCGSGNDKPFAVGNFNSDADNYCDFTFLGTSSTTISPPLVSDVSPDISPVGSLLTVEGENLNDLSSVKLGDIDAPHISESSTELSIKVPPEARLAGTLNVFDRITIMNNDSMFCDVLKNVSVSPVLVDMPPEVEQHQSQFVLGCDADFDGKGEVFSFGKIRWPRHLTEYKPKGHVTLLKRTPFPGGSDTLSSTTDRRFFDISSVDIEGFALGDVNGDNLLDVCVGVTWKNTGESTFEFLLGDSVRHGMFRFASPLTLPFSIRNAVVAPTMGDFDGDGTADICFIKKSTNEDTIVVITNPVARTEHAIKTKNAAGGFRTIQVSGNEIFCVGESTLVVYRYESSGGGTINLESTTPIRRTTAPRSLVCKDMDGDGLTDAVIGDDELDSTVVTVVARGGIPNRISMNISVPKQTQGATFGERVFVLDNDGDRRIDIVVCGTDNIVDGSQTTNQMVLSHNNLNFTRQKIGCTVLYNRTNPSDTSLSFELSSFAIEDSHADTNRVAVCDIDGDGFEDLVVMGTSPSVIRPPFLTDVSRERMVGGGPITVEGSGLETTTSVNFCDVACTPASSFLVQSDSQLTVVLPPDTGRKYLTITNPYGSAGWANPTTILAAPDMFVSVPPESLTIANEKGGFVKPVKRGKGLYPNWTNLLEETVVQGGFQPGSTESDSAGGLRVGISYIYKASPGKWKPIKDSALVHSWLAVRGWDIRKNAGKNWSGIQKTLRNKTFTHTGEARGLDSTGNPGDPKRKRFKGELKILDPKKTSNKLFAELVALKFNIAASQLGKTPVGFGELIYDNDTSEFDEMSIVELSRKADSAMTFYRDYDTSYYDNLYQTLYQINRAFVGPLDTASFEVGRSLVLNGTVDILTIPFLKIPAGSFSPRILLPTTTLTESIEDDEGEGIEEVETLPTVARLYQNYPNPFNPVTTITFGLKENSIVSLKIYNILGQVVTELIDNEEMIAGNYTVEFDAENLSSGVYYYKLVVNEIQNSDGKILPSAYSEIKKMLLLK